VITFEIQPQRRGDLAVTKYRDGNQYIGGVARVCRDTTGRPMVNMTRPVSLEGLKRICEELESATKDWAEPALVTQPDDVAEEDDEV
jgi:hypothetical protein